MYSMKLSIQIGSNFVILRMCKLLQRYTSLQKFNNCLYAAKNFGGKGRNSNETEKNFFLSLIVCIHDLRLVLVDSPDVLHDV